MRAPRLRRGLRSVAVVVPSLVLVGVALLVTGRATGVFDVVVVLSGSMEPTLRPGDAAVLVDRDPATVDVGDVLAFHATRSTARDGTLTLHRAVAVEEEDGVRVARTRGDASSSIDRRPVPLDGSTPVAEVTQRVPLLGHVLLWSQTRPGRLALYVGALLVLAGPAIRWFRRAWHGSDDRPAQRPGRVGTGI